VASTLFQPLASRTHVSLIEASSVVNAFVKSVDIRGNTDESWRRGLDYILSHYLLREP
jgi:Protein of unknown function (DUF2380)